MTPSFTVHKGPAVSKDHNELFFRVKQSRKMKALQLFQMSGTTSPVTGGHNPEELDVQQNCCEELVSHYCLLTLEN